MSVARDVHLTPRQRHHKALARELIEAVGGVEAAASYCRAGKSQLSDYCNPNVAAFMPCDVVADLEAAAGRPIVTRFLATSLSHELVRLPSASAAGTKFARLIGALGKEAGELTNGICQDLDDDNDVSPDEAEKRLADADDLVRVAVELREALKRRAEGRY